LKIPKLAGDATCRKLVTRNLELLNSAIHVSQTAGCQAAGVSSFSTRCNKTEGHESSGFIQMQMLQ